MNLIQQAEQLKSLPDQQLAQMQQRPTEVPPYLIVAEMQRRASMRKAFQGAQAQAMPQQPPVAQQLAQPQQQMPQQQPVQMAGGGRVKPPPGGLASLAGYFSQMSGGNDSGGPIGQYDMTPYFQSMSGPDEVDQSMLGMDLPGYSSMNDAGFNAQRALKLNPKAPRDWQEHMKLMEAQSGESPLKAIADKYGADEEKYRNKKMGLGEILMNLGLSMAASKRPDFLGALGEGGVGALQGWRQDKDRNVTLADRAAARQERAMEGVQRHKDRTQDYSIDAARSDQARYNQERQYDMSIEAQIQRQAREENSQASMLERQEAAQRAMEDRMVKKDELDTTRRANESEVAFGRQKELARLEASLRQPSGSSESSKDTQLYKLMGSYNVRLDNLRQDIMFLEEQASKLIPTKNPNDPTAIRKQKILEELEKKKALAYAVGQEHQYLLEQATTRAANRTGFAMPKGDAPPPDKDKEKDTIRIPPPPPAKPQGPGMMDGLGKWFSYHAPLPWNQ
jgi:hypothetical protein